MKNSFEKVLLARNFLLDIRVMKIGRCINYRYVDIRGGGCRAQASPKYGSVYAPDPLCPFYECGFLRGNRVSPPIVSFSGTAI